MTMPRQQLLHVAIGYLLSVGVQDRHYAADRDIACQTIRGRTRAVARSPWQRLPAVTGSRHPDVSHFPVRRNNQWAVYDHRLRVGTPLLPVFTLARRRFRDD